MRTKMLSLAAFAALMLTSAASAAPSITGVAGCILKEYTKLGTDGWDVYVDTNYSGNTGAGTRINACQSNMARNINYGNYATAQEVNQAFIEMEQNIYKQFPTFKLIPTEPVNNTTVNKDPVVRSTARYYVAPVQPTKYKNVLTSKDLTDLRPF